MKKFLVFTLIILAFALSACLPHGGEPSSSAAPTEPPEEHDDRFADTDLDLIDMGDHYIWTARSYGRYYYYHDKTTGEFGVLCSKPECMHDANGIDRECDGFVECSIPSITYYEGKLYFFDTHKEAGEAEKLSLMRMEPDGTRREFVKYIDIPAACTPVCFGIYRGTLFVYAREQSVVGAEPNIAVDIFVSDLKSGEFTNIYRDQYGSYVPFVYLRYRGGYMYFFCGLRADADSGLSCEIHRYDPESGELVELLSPTNIGDRSPQDFWVCGDGTFLFTANSDNDITEPAEVWRVNDGAAEPYMLALDEGAEPEAYRINYLGENAVFSMKLVYDESYSSGTWYLWVRDFEGATIAKGSLPFAFREGIDVNNATLYIGRGGGDDACFIAEFCNMAYDRDSGRQLYYLVSYTFEDGGLHETLLAYMITD